MQNLSGSRGNDGEYDHTRGQDNMQLMKNFGSRDKALDGRLKKDADNIGTLKNEARDQGKEIGQQLGMLNAMNKRVENTEIKMKKIDGKLEKFVATSSTKKIKCYIAI